jgi:predicted DCC family thiol-disulfide oxidoreductase YuxK
MTPLTTSVREDALTSERFPLLLFFDGQCAFCDRWVDRIREADRGHRIRFGTKQGRTFQEVALRHPELANVESVVLARRRAGGDGEDFLVRSEAVREAIRGLPAFRFFDVVLGIVPARLSDVGYRIFSKLRTRVFGRLPHCRVPSAEERELYVD